MSPAAAVSTPVVARGTSVFPLSAARSPLTGSSPCCVVEAVALSLSAARSPLTAPVPPASPVAADSVVVVVGVAVVVGRLGGGRARAVAVAVAVLLHASWRAGWGGGGSASSSPHLSYEYLLGTSSGQN